jgi:hypothetical protein
MRWPAGGDMYDVIIGLGGILWLIVCMHGYDVTALPVNMKSVIYILPSKVEFGGGGVVCAAGILIAFKKKSFGMQGRVVWIEYVSAEPTASIYRVEDICIQGNNVSKIRRFVLWKKIRCSSVGIVTRLRVERQEYGFDSRTGTEIYIFFTASRHSKAHPASYPVGTGYSFHLMPRLGIGGAIPPLLSYVSTSWRLNTVTFAYIFTYRQRWKKEWKLCSMEWFSHEYCSHKYNIMRNPWRRLLFLR